VSIIFTKIFVIPDFAVKKETFTSFRSISGFWKTLLVYTEVVVINPLGISKNSCMVHMPNDKFMTILIGACL
jgi:hypothetical protein